MPVSSHSIQPIKSTMTSPPWRSTIMSRTQSTMMSRTMSTILCVTILLPQVSRLWSGVHWLPVVRCAFVACVISLVEWSILSAVHSHERDDNVALVVSMILVSFCFQCTNRMIHVACPDRSKYCLKFPVCCQVFFCAPPQQCHLQCLTVLP
jgi:hypothetical protein